MKKSLVKTVYGVAIFKDEEGYYFEGKVVPCETEQEAEETVKVAIEYNRPLTDDEGVYKMFELGLMRKWFHTDEKKKITEKWIQTDNSLNAFVINSDGVLRVDEDTLYNVENCYYDTEKHCLVFKDEEDEMEFIVSLVEVEKCLNLEIGIVTLAR